MTACLAILEDKDAAAMVAALAPAIDRAVCTELGESALATRSLPGAASHPAAELAGTFEEAGVPAEAEPDFGAALDRALAIAAGPPPGALLVTGSHYGSPGTGSAAAAACRHRRVCATIRAWTEGPDPNCSR